MSVDNIKPVTKRDLLELAPEEKQWILAARADELAAAIKGRYYTKKLVATLKGITVYKLNILIGDPKAYKHKHTGVQYVLQKPAIDDKDQHIETNADTFSDTCTEDIVEPKNNTIKVDMTEEEYELYKTYLELVNKLKKKI